MTPPAQAANISEVLAQLDEIIADARSESSRLGYFAVLYRKVTRRVAQEIANGFFEDGPRMERLDTNFANRYFAALSALLTGGRIPKTWGVSFASAADKDAIVLQHLLLGINAHINVDLGAAVAQVAPGEAVKTDFDRIGEILSELTDQVQQELATVSPRIGELDELGGGLDERFAVFSITAARNDAWLLATALSAAPEIFRGTMERLSDQKAAFLGLAVAHPPPPARNFVAAVRAAEETNVQKIIEALIGEPRRAAAGQQA